MTRWPRWLAPPMTPAMMSRSPWCEVCGAGIRARGMVACCYREAASLLRSKSLKTPHVGHVCPSQIASRPRARGSRAEVPLRNIEPPLAPTGAGITR